MAKIIQSFVADVNGDGVLDVVTLDSDNRWTALNRKTGRTDDIPAFPPGHQVQGWPCWGRYFIADFTGDGIADRAYYSADGKWYIINGANGGPGVPGAPWGEAIAGWPGDGRISVADFDGDGKAERCYLSADGKWFVVGSNGAPGIPGIPWGSQIPGWPGDGHYFVGDFNGDGAADRMYLSPQGGWYFVNSKNGGPGSPGLPWGHTIPGWPGGGRYCCFDFNKDGMVDRCFVSPEGRVYCVSSANGAPMQGVPQLGNWGDQLQGVGKVVLDVVLFQAYTAVCAYSLGVEWLACLEAIKQGYDTYSDIRDLMNANLDREQRANESRNSSYSRQREPYLRAYPPTTSPPVPSTCIPDLGSDSLGVHVEQNCKAAGVPGTPTGSSDRTRPDGYTDHGHDNDNGGPEEFEHAPGYELPLAIHTGRAALLTMTTLRKKASGG